LVRLGLAVGLAGLACAALAWATGRMAAAAAVDLAPSHPAGRPASLQASAAVTLVVATDPYYPPMEYYSGTQIVGHDIDLMDAIATEMGVTVVYLEVAWDALFPGLAAGDYDAVISSLTVTPNREEIIDFTLPYVTITDGFDQDFAIAVRAGNHALRTQISDALWKLRADGTLGAIVGQIAADIPSSQARLPDWPVLPTAPGMQSTLTYTNMQGLRTVVQVPIGAVTTETTLLYVPIDTVTATAGYSFTGRGLELWAYRNVTEPVSDLAFGAPVTVTLTYADANLAGLSEASLFLAFWNADTMAWEPAGCGPAGHNPIENWLAVPICHLSRFALLGLGNKAYLPLAVTSP
jgi:hypothetical protein